MLRTVVLIVHMVVAVLIIGLVLLQRGKGADAGTGFGAGASATVFGARGSANFLSRATAVLVTVFFATSLSLAFLAGQPTAPASLLERAAAGSSGTSAVPAPTQPPPPQPANELPQLPTLPLAPTPTDEASDP